MTARRGRRGAHRPGRVLRRSARPAAPPLPHQRDGPRPPRRSGRSPISTWPTWSRCASRTSRRPAPSWSWRPPSSTSSPSSCCPASPDDADESLDEEGELLRQELAERLQEYARIKALGAWLGAARGGAGAALRPHRQRAAAARGHPARGSLGASPAARAPASDRGAEATGAARDRAQPALGARAHERDPRAAAPHVVAALLLGGRAASGSARSGS